MPKLHSCSGFPAVVQDDVNTGELIGSYFNFFLIKYIYKFLINLFQTYKSSLLLFH